MLDAYCEVFMVCLLRISMFGASKFINSLSLSKLLFSKLNTSFNPDYNFLPKTKISRNRKILLKSASGRGFQWKKFPLKNRHNEKIYKLQKPVWRSGISGTLFWTCSSFVTFRLVEVDCYWQLVERQSTCQWSFHIWVGENDVTYLH